MSKDKEELEKLKEENRLLHLALTMAEGQLNVTTRQTLCWKSYFMSLAKDGKGYLNSY